MQILMIGINTITTTFPTSIISLSFIPLKLPTVTVMVTDVIIILILYHHHDKITMTVI